MAEGSSYFLFKLRNPVIQIVEVLSVTAKLLEQSAEPSVAFHVAS